jgi:hypothetical protein
VQEKLASQECSAFESSNTQVLAVSGKFNEVLKRRRNAFLLAHPFPLGHYSQTDGLSLLSNQIYTVRYLAPSSARKLSGPPSATIPL